MFEHYKAKNRAKILKSSKQVAAHEGSTYSDVVLVDCGEVGTDDFDGMAIGKEAFCPVRT